MYCGTSATSKPRTFATHTEGVAMRATALLVSFAVISLLPTTYATANEPSADALQALDRQTRQLDRVHSVVVAYDGEIIHELHQGGPGWPRLPTLSRCPKPCWLPLPGQRLKRASLNPLNNLWWRYLAIICRAAPTRVLMKSPLRTYSPSRQG